MRAHLIPFAAGSAAASPAATAAACRLDAEDGSGWVLALSDDLEAPFEVEHLDARAGGTGTSAAVVEFDGPRDAAQVAADRRASRDRIGPAAMQVQGALGAVVLRAATAHALPPPPGRPAAARAHRAHDTWSPSWNSS